MENFEFLTQYKKEKAIISPSVKKQRLPEFTKEDLYNCWPFYEEYLVDILNKEYELDQAIDDLRSLIGTKFDLREGETYEE